MRLERFGWSPAFLASALAPGHRPARVLRQDKDRCLVATEDGDATALVPGRFRGGPGAPVAGDWVVVHDEGDGAGLRVAQVLPRRTVFQRKRPGAAAEAQVLAANVDAVLLVMALDDDFSVRRLERYLVLAHESGARPVVVLNKADACPHVASLVGEARAVAGDAPVLPMSAATGGGVRALDEFLVPGTTLALLGSSGVGKSSLVNRLLGEERLDTAPVREADAKGRHTTTRRELVPLPGGALLLDTPGMREVALWTDGEGVNAVFHDIEALARACRFRDCAHETEPGCAVRAALMEGTLDPARYESYARLRDEAAALAKRRDVATHRKHMRSWGRLIDHAKQAKEDRRRGV